MHLWYMDTAREVRAVLLKEQEQVARRDMADEAEAWLSGDWRHTVCVCLCLSCSDYDGHPNDDDAWEWLADRRLVTFTLLDHVR